MNRTIKIVLAILFFICLQDMPYGYFQLVRFLALIGFSILAYQANNHVRQPEIFIYIRLAIIFQPLIKISFGRQLWSKIDVVVGIGERLGSFWISIWSFSRPEKVLEFRQSRHKPLLY